MLPFELYRSFIRTIQLFVLYAICIFSISTISTPAYSQSCPYNIDFETGTFDRWTCYTGSVSASGGVNVMTLYPSNGPVPGKHTMYAAYPGDGLDPYGGFPVNCPNGSGNSIRLGEARGGGQANGVSYDFTIPANQNEYNLTYNYAVVFQDPNHLEFQQPRLEIEILNVTDNSIIGCSSFSFHPFGTVLPGFMVSPNPGGNTPVYYKEWSPVSIDLSGLAGKSIKLLFKVAGCTFSAHFGYAYIDVSSDCNGSLAGAVFCPTDSIVKVTAPYGFQSYTWYDSSITQILGNQQTLTLNPPPVSGTKIAVKVEPYSGYGCTQIYYIRLMDTLNIIANAGSNISSCNAVPVRIGSLPKPGLTYSWQPVTGLSDPHVANPLANPSVVTTYVVTVGSEGGGCTDTDTVIVRTGELINTLELIGNAVLCSGNANAAILRVQPADSIQWFRDNVAIAGANQTELTANITGAYYAALYSNAGCSTITRTQGIINSVASPPVASFVPATGVAQCLTGNQFRFTNTSINSSAVQYKWLMGDGLELSTKDASYIYTRSGNYQVTLVTSNGGCADSSKLPVQVYQNAIADFNITPVCINLPAQFTNNTVDTVSSPISYIWNLGNGQISNLRTPPPQIYTIAGNYPISLSVSTAQCPTPLMIMKRTLSVSAPSPGTNYPLEYAVINLPLPLRARSLGNANTYLWSPGINLDNRTIPGPVFKGSSDQLYTIEIKTSTGCITVDTQLVKTVKNIEVYVPTAFTPNGDGKNDFLRPIARGLKQLNFFKVSDRWGQTLFETKSAMPGWNGLSKGIPLPTMTVIWMLEGLGADGKIYRRQGTSILIR